jgi:HPt (histidine-containing phosphotransfer) domain-containing protein
MGENSSVYNQKAIDNLLRIGEQELVLQVLHLYRAHVPPKVQSLQLFLKDENFFEVERTAHSIKSSAGNLGLDDVLEAARALEYAGAQKEASSCAQALAALEIASEKANESLNNLEKNMQL